MSINQISDFSFTLFRDIDSSSRFFLIDELFSGSNPPRDIHSRIYLKAKLTCFKRVLIVQFERSWYVQNLYVPIVLASRGRI